MMRVLAPEALLDGTTVRFGWAVAYRDGWIEQVGPLEQLRAALPGCVVLEAPQRLLMPGLVNAHSHSFQSLLRGLGDDRPFAAWRDVLYRFTPRLGPEDVYTAGLFAFGEMLRYGTTTVCDFFYLHHGDNERAIALAQAAEDLGIRLVLARSMMDWDVAPAAYRETPEQAVANGRALASRFQGHSLVRVIPAPHSPHGASGEMIQAGARLAAELDTPWHIHVAEAPYEGEQIRRRYGCGPLEWIEQLGALDERIRIVHGVWLEEQEIAALGRAGGGLIHCPGSNLFLGDGIAPLRVYLQHGVTVTLGCDSGSANSRLSMFDEMRLAATLQKGLAGSGDALGAAEVLHMATANGEHVTGLPLGRIAPGMLADFCLIRLDDLSMQPRHRIAHNLVYSLHHGAVTDVYVHGEPVVREGHLVRVAEAAIVERARRLTESWMAELYRAESTV
uniref:Amidohydrolase n=2 Tax=Thermorudis TaxID=1649508 RepID=A0A831TFB4_9BACT